MGGSGFKFHYQKKLRKEGQKKERNMKEGMEKDCVPEPLVRDGSILK